MVVKMIKDHPGLGLEKGEEYDTNRPRALQLIEEKFAVDPRKEKAQKGPAESEDRREKNAEAGPGARRK